jgi:NAD-dependent deacetylase
MKHLVVLTGAGISAESGIRTFRDSDGLWENYDVSQVATIEGWYRNPSLVLDFYNQRRKQIKEAFPNKAHRILAELEATYKVSIITQNIDDLHERAGSSHVTHLHGEITKACNEEKTIVTEIGYNEILLEEKAPDGSQLRPFIVWFGEAVPMMDKAIELVQSADILLVVGTSLQVYPAAGLTNFAPAWATVYLIDPSPSGNFKKVSIIAKKATEGMEDLKKILTPDL